MFGEKLRRKKWGKVREHPPPPPSRTITETFIIQGLLMPFSTQLIIFPSWSFWWLCLFHSLCLFVRLCPIVCLPLSMHTLSFSFSDWLILCLPVSFCLSAVLMSLIGYQYLSVYACTTAYPCLYICLLIIFCHSLHICSPDVLVIWFPVLQLLSILIPCCVLSVLFPIRNKP